VQKGYGAFHAKCLKWAIIKAFNLLITKTRAADITTLPQKLILTKIEV
jgi:hypothetical protein